jgi:hypothetical protein
MNRARNDFPPSISVKHPVNGRVMDLMVQQILKGFLDLTGDANLARGGRLKKRLEKAFFLVFAQIGSPPLAELRPFYRFRTESVVLRDHVMNRGNGNVCVNCDFPGRTRVYQCVPYHQPSAMLPSGRLLEPN